MNGCQPDDHRGERISREDDETRTYECAECGAEWWEDKEPSA